LTVSPSFDRHLRTPKRYIVGTHRTRRPDESIAAYAPFAARMGITRLADITGLDCIGLPVYTAIRPNSRSLSTSQGKGIDKMSAKASALMESVESWHAENITSPLRWDSYAALRRHEKVVDIDRLLRRQNRNVQYDAPRLWIEGYDLIQEGAIWVPFEVVSLYFVSEGGLNPSPFVQSSTGLAAGNHLVEAVAHGLYEVIERDAEALWVQMKQPVGVDLETVDDFSCRYVLSLLADAGIQVGAWDLTTDIRIPAYACVIMEEPNADAWRGYGAYSGFGCHSSPAIALLRALTEAIQSRVTFVAGSRDDMYRSDYTSLSFDEGQRVRWDELRHNGILHAFANASSVAAATFEEDISVVLERLTSVGLGSAVVVDLTKPEYSIPVVKVLVPGLEETGQDNEIGERAVKVQEQKAIE
jgi:YcaO-like protein with predicted kinase domain